MIALNSTSNAAHSAARGIALSALRVRFQLLAGILLCSVLPGLLRGHSDIILYLESASGRNTLLGTSIAVALGVVFLRQITRFPGVNDTYYVLPSFALAYGTTILTFFLFRIDYSRFQFILSFVAAVGWFFALYLVARRYEIYRFAVLPGVELSGQSRARSTEWLRLHNPILPSAPIYGVIADLRNDLPEEWERFITDCALQGVPVFHVKQAMESLTGRVEIEHLSENTLGSLLPNHAYLLAKAIIDRLVALVALLVLWPLLLIVCVAIRFDSKGPAVFRQMRTGYRGQPFTIYKLRTMRSAESATNTDRQSAITRDDDPRITRLGRLLRRTRIDELPQMINILRGEMSWIGPRPEAKVLSDSFETDLPFYHYRYIVRPGITGWAQVNQGHVVTEQQVLEKLHYDFFYIKHFSLWLDILILFRTASTVLTGFGAR